MFKGKSIDTSKIKCFSCNKLDHFARDCWYRKKIQGKGNIIPQLMRMMNPKENKKVLLMKEKIEKNIT
jgi:hypothetical protein